MHYTKLFSSILDSTIWQTPPATKLVWITLLAMSDRRGEIHASVPGLAVRAGVTIEEVESALTCFRSPDAYSRTKTEDGRRIEDIDGGWRLLNHAKYRALMSLEERREYNREKQREHRSKNVKECQQVSAAVSSGQAPSAHAESDSDAESDAINTPKAPKGASVGSNEDKPKEKKPRVRKSRHGLTYSAEFEEFWQRYPNKKAKPIAYAAYCKVPITDQLAILDDLDTRVNSDEWRKELGKFIPHPSTYLNQRRWEDQSVRLLPGIQSEDICDLPLDEIKRRMAGE